MKNKLAILALGLSIFSLLAGCEPQITPNTAQGTTDSYSDTRSNDSDSKDATTKNTSTTKTDSTMTDSNPQTAAPVAGDTVAILETDMGTIKFKIFTEQVPEISKNFIELSKSGKYKDTPFHRVVKDFMIQTGDFTNKNGTGGYSYKGPGTELPDEIAPSLKHLYGTVSMANAGPDTNGSQFFIVTSKKGASFLDGGYSIFGQVYEGMDVAEKIQDLQVPHTEKPSKLVLIKSVKIETIGK